MVEGRSPENSPGTLHPPRQVGASATPAQPQSIVPRQAAVIDQVVRDSSLSGLPCTVQYRIVRRCYPHDPAFRWSSHGSPSWDTPAVCSSRPRSEMFGSQRAVIAAMRSTTSAARPVTVKATGNGRGTISASSSSETIPKATAAEVVAGTGFRHGEIRCLSVARSLISLAAEGTVPRVAGRQRAQRTPDFRSVLYMRCAIALTRSSSVGCGISSPDPVLRSRALPHGSRARENGRSSLSA